MQGECQRTIGAIHAFSMAWRLQGVHILLQGGKLVRVGTPPRLKKNRPLQHTRYFHRLLLGTPRLPQYLSGMEFMLLA